MFCKFLKIYGYRYYLFVISFESNKCVDVAHWDVSYLVENLKINFSVCIIAVYSQQWLATSTIFLNYYKTWKLITSGTHTQSFVKAESLDGAWLGPIKNMIFTNLVRVKLHSELWASILLYIMRAGLVQLYLFVLQFLQEKNRVRRMSQ